MLIYSQFLTFFQALLSGCSAWAGLLVGVVEARERAFIFIAGEKAGDGPLFSVSSHGLSRSEVVRVTRGGGACDFEDGERLLDSESGETEPIALRSSNLFPIGGGAFQSKGAFNRTRNFLSMYPGAMCLSPIFQYANLSRVAIAGRKAEPRFIPHGRYTH